jgi:hypothetical protein
MDHLPAPEKKDQLEAILEGELHSQLDHALAALGRDLAEVIFRGVREGEALTRIAHVRGRTAISVGEELGYGLGLAYGGE